MQYLFDFVFQALEMFLASDYCNKINFTTGPFDSRNLTRLSSSYVHQEIMTMAKQEMKYTHSFDLVIEGAYIKILYHTNSVKQYIIRFIIWYTSFIIFMLSRAKRLPQNIHVNVFNISHTKKLPKDSDEFDTINVNSGYSETWINSSTVVVYREEEIFKVIIHELIHAIRLDNKNIEFDREKEFYEFFGLDEYGIPLRINEAFTDTLACALNVALYTILEARINGSHSERDFLYTCYRNNLRTETSFILNQACKVLQTLGYGYNYYGLKQKDKNRDKKIIEKTHVTSYYILKAVLFVRLNRFVRYCKKNTLQFNDVDSVIAMLKHELYQPSLFWKRIGSLSKCTENGSMRMSKIDISTILKRNKTKLLKTLYNH